MYQRSETNEQAFYSWDTVKVKANQKRIKNALEIQKPSFKIIFQNMQPTEVIQDQLKHGVWNPSGIRATGSFN
jgi:hypothetical protein